jgi:hypothetical protein
MARVRVRQTYSGSPHEAQTCWCEVSHWPQWVDGAARVLSVDDGWPHVGSTVVWESGPDGRGRVTERVVTFEPLAELAFEVSDDAMEARQYVIFDPVPEGVAVELTLDYRMRRRSPVAPLVESLFVRRPMTLSLTRTLERFGTALEAARAMGLG